MAIALVWQPALLAAAEAHERVHAFARGEHLHGGHDDHPAAGHAASDHRGPATSVGASANHDHGHAHGHAHGHDADSMADPGDSPDGAAGHPGAGLHALLHAMHCCGYPSALPALLFAPVVPLSALIPPATAHAGRPGPLLAHPLRPPIAG